MHHGVKMLISLTMIIQQEVDFPDIDEDYDGYEEEKNKILRQLEDLGYEVSVESEEPIGP